MNAQQHSAADDSSADEFSFVTFLDAISDHRWLVISIFLIASLLGAGYALIAKPVYSTDLLVQVEDSPNTSKNLLGSLSSLSSLVDVKADSAAEIEILRSRTLASQAVDSLRLNVFARARYFPLIGSWIASGQDQLSTPGLLGYGGYAWGAEKIEVARFEIPKSLDDQDFVLTVTAPGHFILRQNAHQIVLEGEVGKELNIAIGEGNIVLKVAALNGKPGAKFILRHASRMQTVAELQKSMTIVEKGKGSGILNISLQGHDPELIARTLNGIGLDYVRQNVARKSEEAEQTLAFLDKKLPELRAELEQSENKYNQFRNSSSTINLGEESKLMLQQNVAAQTRLIELKQKRESLLIGFTNDHPAVIGINRQIADINDELQKYSAQIKRLPLLEQNLFRLNRDVKVNTDLYTALLNSAQQLRLVKAGKVGNVRIIDPALVPEHPLKPHRSVIVLLSMALGLFAGMLCAIVKKLVFDGVSDAFEIEEALGVTVFASIPRSKKQEQLFQKIHAKAPSISVLAQNFPTDMAVEGLRGLRTALQFSMLESRNNVVLITGPTPGLGKSFVAANFAAVLAAAGKKVLLIDADLRKGYLHQYFGLERGNGLSDLITASEDIDQVLHKELLENVSFISTGQLPLKPAELLSHQNFGKLIESLSANYDYVLIDTPPVLAVSDAVIAAAHAATVLLIARAEVTGTGAIKEALKRLAQAGISSQGVVLNDVKLRSSRYGTRDGRYRQEKYAY
ncbi:polysaccharide biosynthesis tyrosine autokinase [Collimonas pratensis]|uniref:polysaccharide biosynthesis tyrosine autokinase n=1 Tax=Collimonas pratensis TaxID=279113 RepID=UPI00143E02DE|nr:polysaccharide biosynthesis tyrosine autokinase [Collimonas pratensis]NKI70579.1 polysaccharide biosynthesis tyrosine autokinase [Collimonas pratensis]